MMACGPGMWVNRTSELISVDAPSINRHATMKPPKGTPRNYERKAMVHGARVLGRFSVSAVRGFEAIVTYT